MNIEKVIKDSLVNFDGKVAVYYDDLNGNVLKINEEEKYNSASCIKIFILIELFNQISNRTIHSKTELIYLDKHYVNGSEVMRYLSKGIKLPILHIATLMMIISDNVTTNMLIDFLEIDKINKMIENIGCKDTKLHNNPYITNILLVLFGYEIHRKNMKLKNYNKKKKELYKKRVKEALTNHIFVRKLEEIRISQMIWTAYFINTKLIEVGRLQYERCDDHIKIHIPSGENLEIEKVLQSVKDSK